MQVVEMVADMQQVCRQLRGEARRQIGLVPTMGALHAGHLSLVRRARAENDVVAVTIFVNPLQFGPGEDLERYPRQLARDLELLRGEGVDLVFAPTVPEMYPAGAKTAVEVAGTDDRLDGAARPGHFRGVATVVAKLFHIVAPHRAYFGRKDAMQVAVLRQMVRDLNFDLELIACEIVRDPDGLAMSSRNAYLTAAERWSALAIPRALERMQALVAAGERERAAVLAAGHAVLAAETGLHVQYLDAVDAATLYPVERLGPGTLVMVAAYAGATRLIDNFLCGPFPNRELDNPARATDTVPTTSTHRA